MALLGGLSIVIVLLVFLAILTFSNAIVLSIAHSDLNKNKDAISSDPHLQSAQRALYVDLWISWSVVVLYFVLIGAAILIFIFGGEFIVGGLSLTAPAAVATEGARKSTSKLALGTVLVLVAVALLFFGLVIGVESFYAAQAARNIIKSTSFSGTGSLSSAYWYSFVSAALGLVALVLILVALGSMVMTWIIQGRSKAIIKHLREVTRRDAEEVSANLKKNNSQVTSAIAGMSRVAASSSRARTSGNVSTDGRKSTTGSLKRNEPPTISVPAKPSTPVVNTSTPVPSNPSTPVPAKPSTPVPAKPSTPVPAKPSTPVVNTSTPVVNTSTPVVNTSTPVVNTSTPVVNTSTPVVNTSTPVVNTSTPVVNTSTPVVNKPPPSPKKSSKEIEEEIFENV